MEKKDNAEGGAGSTLLRPIALALNGGSKSKYIVNWAIETFVPEGNVSFKLIHVFPKITAVPTPMGNMIPLAQVRNDIAAAYKKEIEWQKAEMMMAYQKLFKLKKVPAEIILIESDEIAKAISMEVSKHRVEDLVIGASSNRLFARKVKEKLLSSIISECAPSFCTVYVVSKRKLESLRPSDLETNENFTEYDSSACDSTNSSSRYTTSTFGSTSTSESPFPSSRLPSKRVDSLAKLKHGHNGPGKDSTELTNYASIDTRDHGSFASCASSAKSTIADDESWSYESIDTRDEDDALSSRGGSFMSCKSSDKSVTEENESSIPDQVSPPQSRSTSDQSLTPRSHFVSSAEGQMNIHLELEKLRIELRHIRGMYAIAQTETMDVSRRLSDLSKLRTEEETKLKEIREKEERAKELARLGYATESGQREVFQRRQVALEDVLEAKEKEKLKDLLAGSLYQFTWEEIFSATSSFNEELKIGEGSLGTVYKCRLRDTTVAVKALHSKEGPKNKQFHKELETLSRIRHPHLLPLLGACPEQGCLVYEYMENGSLEDRLFHKNDKPPIPWFERFRIAWEIASALAFLHNNKLKPIIHRDLKPANILLDNNLVSKISDAGLCMMLNLEPSISPTNSVKDKNPVGALCYIDPDYQRTGIFSTKSDVYALGVIILQLLTAKPAVGITHLVEHALSEGHLSDVLDKDAGRWPTLETAELAQLAIQCVELRHRDRPDLKHKVLPTLERIKDVAEKVRDMTSGIQLAPPSHFICPILEDVMEEPCVASDGYTYDRKAIEMWLKENDTSPKTNFPMSNKNLIPNYTLHYAIMEWKSKRKPTPHDDHSSRIKS